MAVVTAPAASRPEADLRFLWLEITEKCQLECGHCYPDSGPDGTHGQMMVSDWRRVVSQAAGLGVKMVQFIGGEPTLHSGLPELVEHALGHDLQVEVYSNLVRVSDQLWELFRLPGVSLATSFYSDDPAEHARIVGGSRSAHRRTLANIGLARSYGIPIRAGLISFSDRQRVGAAVAQLQRLGIQRTGVDHVRGVGRGAAGQQPSVDALCGQCANGKLAVLPDGTACPCVFSRWPKMHAGNVLHQSLEQILTGQPLTTTRTQLQTTFDQRFGACAPCRPDCNPNCAPSAGDPCGPECPPNGLTSAHTGARPVIITDCRPNGNGDPIPCRPDDCNPICAPNDCGPVK